MRTETISIFKFDELPSVQAKEAAREKGRQWLAEDPAWVTESRKSIQAFCEAFGIRLTAWSVGAYAPISFSTDAENKHFRGRKLNEFKPDACPTGYCLDFTLWGSFCEEFKKTGSAFGAFKATLDAGFEEWRADLEAQLEDEYIDDFLSANDYEFTADGRVYH